VEEVMLLLELVVLLLVVLLEGARACLNALLLRFSQYMLRNCC
jgi:hypothetical protein